MYKKKYKKNKLIAVIAVLAVILPLIFLVRGGQNIQSDISAIEKHFCAVLKDFGVNADNLVNFEEIEWKKCFLRGKTLLYEYQFRGRIDPHSLKSKLCKQTQQFKNFRIEKIALKADKKNNTEDLEILIVYKAEPILKAKIKCLLTPAIKTVEKPGKTIASIEKELPEIAIVLDDFGYNKNNLSAIDSLNIPITLAVLPSVPCSRDICLAVENSANLEAILHLPMQPENTMEQVENNTITVNMDARTIDQIITNSLRSVYCAKGVSNHMGSRATHDRNLMTLVFGCLKQYDKFFLDSLTTPHSVCSSLANEMAIPVIKRDVFIDSRLDADTIKQQIKKTGDIARRKGYAVAIGHDRKLTVSVLKEVIPGLKKDFKFVFLTNIIGKTSQKD